jgi:hypothetical protein
VERDLLRKFFVAGILCVSLISSFVQPPTVSANDHEVVSSHWAETHINELSENHNVAPIFKDKDLDSAITVKDFQELVKLVIDGTYGDVPDSTTREAIVYEFTRIWAERTGRDLASIPVIMMLLYSDTDEIDAKYIHSTTVAYSANIAKGKGNGIFAPKDLVTYGELAALVINTHRAIENELISRIETLEDEFEHAHYAIGDIDGDGVFELASIVRTNIDIPSVKLQVYGFANGSCELKYETQFQHGDYPHIVTIGQVRENQKGIFVELGLGAHSAITEIVVEENGEYKNVLPRKDEYDFSPTFKPYPLYSMDINNDGIVEVGMQTEPLEASHYSMADMPWINNWYQWDGNHGLKKVLEEYSNYSQGYRLIVPESWSGKYTIIKAWDDDNAVSSVHFVYLADNDERAELLVLHHIPKDRWQEKEQELKNNNRSYVLFGENSENMLVAELKHSGKDLSEDNLKELEKMLLDAESIVIRLEVMGDTQNVENTPPDHPRTAEGIIEPEYAKNIIQEISDTVIRAIGSKDSKTMSDYIHPVKGVRFTPYTHVSLERDMVFDKEAINKFFSDQNSYLWGFYDGIGNEIEMTPSEYYNKFIYSRDFLNAESIGYNQVLSSGNMIENQFEVYDDPIVVEYYFSGSPQYAGMDWRSLRLVFEQYEGDWKLVGIIHNQWTI